MIPFVLMVCGCNYLDFDETSGIYTKDDMYRYFSRVKGMLTNVYSYMPQDLGAISNAMRDCGCDDAEYADPSHAIQSMNNGNWSPISTIDTQWSLYNGIRSANGFIVEVENVDISRYESSSSYEQWAEQLAYFPYEARILRAFYFFELARRYGDIAMPLVSLTPEEANSIEKTPFDQVISFIVSECEACAPNLPVSYLDNRVREYGRVTRGFAMALKSKALLYAASRLHNPSMDKTKWEASAKAAHDLIIFAENEGAYRLDPNSKCNSTTSPEIVLCRMNNDSRNFELYNFPFRFTEGNRSSITGTYPTQNLVDAFQTEDGYDIVLTDNGWVTDDPSIDVNSSSFDPYADRDPRFSRTVLANGMSFKGSVIETFEGGADYAATLDLGRTPTGYFLRKYIIENTSFAPEAAVQDKHHWVIYRYAETLLAYAESMIEAFQDPNYTDAEYTKSATWALNEVRRNASMPDVEANTYEEFLEAVRREWRVEFAFEDHRFWDIRRWCIGAETQTDIKGVAIEQTENGYEYTLDHFETRVWNDRMNLYPIPQTELFNNPSLNPQNPGW